MKRDSRGVAARAAAALALLGLVLALTACGSSKSSGTSADPATVVPSSTPVYLGAEVRPEGALEEATLDAGRRLTGRNEPFAGLLGALQTPGSPPLDYSRDVAPWLGHHAAIFLSTLKGADALGQILLAGGQHVPFPFTPGGAQGAVVLGTDDIDAARKFVNQAATRAGANPSSYRGTTLMVTSAGDAFAIVKGFVVLGSQAAVQSVVDTSLGGASLSSSSDYAALRKSSPQQALARLYVSSAVSGPDAGAAGEALGTLIGRGATLASLTPEHNAVTIDFDVLSPAGSQGLLGAGSEGAQALGALPGGIMAGPGRGQHPGRARREPRTPRLAARVDRR